MAGAHRRGRRRPGDPGRDQPGGDVRPVERDHATAPWIGRFWLPLLALCLYAMLWLGWWLYRLLSLDIEPVGSEFPDIDRAWGQALEAMGRADIALDNAPLFLVLGWPSVSEDDFFRAAGIKGPVRQVPGDPRRRCTSRPTATGSG